MSNIKKKTELTLLTIIFNIYILLKINLKKKFWEKKLLLVT